MKLLLAIAVAAAAAVAVGERGEEVKLGGLNTLPRSCAATATAVILVSDIFGYTLPRSCAATATAVILVSDIFGYTLPRLREIADKVGKGLPFNLGQLVFDAVIKVASDSDSDSEGPLLYPNTIFQILVKHAASDSEGSLLYPNIIFQILVKQGCSAKASSDCVLPPVLTFSKTLFTSDRFKDLPYTSSVTGILKRVMLVLGQVPPTFLQCRKFFLVSQT